MLIDNSTLRGNSDHAQVSQTLHRLSRKSVETVTSSSNQKLISRNGRKSLPKEFTVQLDEKGTEQEKWYINTEQTRLSAS